MTTTTDSDDDDDDVVIVVVARAGTVTDIGARKPLCGQREERKRAQER